MKHYDSIPKITEDNELLGKEVWAYNKLDGQNLCVRYTKGEGFSGFGSRKCSLKPGDPNFGNSIEWFYKHYSETLGRILQEEPYFKGAKEITLYFEWYGDLSFAGVHDPADTSLRLALIDVAVIKKGYIEPETFYNIFSDIPGLEIPGVIYKGVLDQGFIESIQKNDPTSPNPQYPTVKEGVVCRGTRTLRGQRMPKVKIKTDWWISELHKRFKPEQWEELE